MLRPRPATAADVGEIWRIRRQREDWLAAAGIDQWRPGEVPVERVAGQVGRGEWFVVEGDGGRLEATVRLLWSDLDFWESDDGRAVYVHGLAVDLTAAGRGLGSALLQWAGGVAREAGRDLLRLDSAATNPTLTRYYEREGFTAVGTSRAPGLSDVVLWERRV